MLLISEEGPERMPELAPTQVTVTVDIRIYPGCEMPDIALREGVVERRQNLLFPALHLSPQVAD